MRRDCPTCAANVTFRRARRIFNRFDAVRRGRPVLRTSFTVPLELRAQFLQRHSWRPVVKALIAHLKKAYGFEFGMEASHPIGDRRPDVFHPHVNVLWLQKPGHSPYLDVEALQTFWRELLDAPGPVVVHHRYYFKKSEIFHKCKYNARTFPGFSVWQGPIRWYGKVPKLAPEIYVCPHCGECYIFLGMALESEYEDQVVRLNTS